MRDAAIRDLIPGGRDVATEVDHAAHPPDDDSGCRRVLVDSAPARRWTVHR